MEIPPEVAFRGFEPDEVIRNAVYAEIERLERFFDRIVTCRVMMELPHRRHRDGNQYHLRIEVSVPGQDLVVNRYPGKDETLDDPMVALKEAFRAMTRQLEDHARRVRGDVKTHEPPAQGRVCRLFSELPAGLRYGFIQDAGGREIYFHENSLLGADFGALEVGTEVRFAEEQGVEGPQASTVRLVGRQQLLDGRRRP